MRFPLFGFDQIIDVSGTVTISDQKGFSVKFTKPIDGLICKEGHFPEMVHEAERN